MKLIKLFCLATFMLCTTITQADTTLTFTEIPCINLVDITDEYAAYGVEFADVYRYVDVRDPWKDLSATLGCGIAYGSRDDPGGLGPNGLIAFDHPTPYATIDWWTIGDDTEYFGAYDSDDNLVDSSSGSGTGTTTLTGSEWISYITFHDSGGLVTVANLTYVEWTEVAIDIKFCSDPNAFNCKKKGVLPVTIFGTDSFDVASIDLSTLQLCTEDLSVCTGAPRDYSIADRGDPTSDLGAAQCALLEVEEGIFEEQDYLNPDGFLDLDAAFEASEVQDMLGTFCGSARNAISETLVITGSTLDGTPIISVPIGNTGTDQLVKKNK
jgi:hypothetical protein